MQSDLFQAAPEVSNIKTLILMHCQQEGLSTKEEAHDPRRASLDIYNRSGWGKTLKWLNHIADQFDVTHWDDLQRESDAKQLLDAVFMARQGARNF